MSERPEWTTLCSGTMSWGRWFKIQIALTDARLSIKDLHRVMRAVEFEIEARWELDPPREMEASDIGLQP